MNPLASLLTIDGIALDVDAPSRKRAFEELSLLFEKIAGIPHREAFDALNARERLGCTALGGGVAIPHGRVQDLDRILVAVLRTKSPVVFDTPDNRRARLFFSILIPANDEEHYLPVLAAVAALLKDRDAKDALLSNPEPVDICKTVSAFAAKAEIAEDGKVAPDESASEQTDESEAT